MKKFIIVWLEPTYSNCIDIINIDYVNVNNGFYEDHLCKVEELDINELCKLDDGILIKRIS